MASNSPRTRLVWAGLLVGFAGLNVWALATAGFEGVITYFTNVGPVSLVASVDLVLALLVGIVLVVRNARERSLSSRGFVLLTLITGSLGLLGYLARHGTSDAERTVTARGGSSSP